MITGQEIETFIKGKKGSPEELEQRELDWMEKEDLRNSLREEEEERERNRIFNHIEGMESTVYAEGGPPFSPDYELVELVKSLTRDVARLFLKIQEGR